MRKSVLFVNDRSETERGVILPNGRIVSLFDENGKFYLNYDSKFSMTTGEILPEDTADESAVCLNDFIRKGERLKEVYCYDRVDVDYTYPRSLTDKMIKNIKGKCATIGVNVTEEAIRHQFECWKYGWKSGYRDDANGYHLFTPCGGNPFSIRCTTLHVKCTDWQHTYMC